MAHELVVVGGGNMGAALLGGLLAAGRSAASLAVVEVQDARRSVLQEQGRIHPARRHVNR